MYTGDSKWFSSKIKVRTNLPTFTHVCSGYIECKSHVLLLYYNIVDSKLFISI